MDICSALGVSVMSANRSAPCVLYVRVSMSYVCRKGAPLHHDACVGWTVGVFYGLAVSFHMAHTIPGAHDFAFLMEPSIYCAKMMMQRPPGAVGSDRIDAGP